LRWVGHCSADRPSVDTQERVSAAVRPTHGTRALFSLSGIQEMQQTKPISTLQARRKKRDERGFAIKRRERGCQRYELSRLLLIWSHRGCPREMGGKRNGKKRRTSAGEGSRERTQWRATALSTAGCRTHRCRKRRRRSFPGAGSWTGMRQPKSRRLGNRHGLWGLRGVGDPFPSTGGNAWSSSLTPLALESPIVGHNSEKGNLCTRTGLFEARGAAMTNVSFPEMNERRVGGRSK